MTRIAIWILAAFFLTHMAMAEEPGAGAPADETLEGGQREVPLFLFEQPNPSPVFLNFYSVFFGPSLKNPSSLIPTPDGRVDPDFPLHFRNYLALGYNIDEQITVSGTAFWVWKPVQGQRMVLRDPFVRLSHSGIFSNEHFNLYGDIRAHIGVSELAKAQDLLAGVQLFQSLSYVPDTQGNLVLSLYGSARYNVFGKHGRGNDLELYLAPHLSYRLIPTLSLTLLYEMQAVHFFGAKVGTLENDGTDLEPGLEWYVTPTLSLNPYINLYPGNQLNLKTTSFGMAMSWNIF